MAEPKFRITAPFDYVSPEVTVAYQAGYEGPLPVAHREVAAAKGVLEPLPAKSEKTAGGE